MVTKYNYTAVLFTLLCFLLTSCFENFISETSGLIISNQSQQDEQDDYEASACAGGLRGKITYPHLDLVVADETAAAGSGLREYFSNLNSRGNYLIYEGMDVEVEAWCYDATGDTIGYTKIIGSLFFDSIPDALELEVRVNPPNLQAQSCGRRGYAPFAEISGNPPCVQTSLWF